MQTRSAVYHFYSLLLLNTVISLTPSSDAWPVMQCYTELIAPSAVSHAVSLHFLSSSAHNLVVAKTSLLQVFELKTIVTGISNQVREGRSGGDQHGLEGPEAYHRTENTSKLVLVGEYPLSGSVTALAKVKALNTKTGGEALLVATEDAKVSLIDWDPDNHRISTISIHYYEGDKIQSAPFGPELSDCDSYLTVDPSSRCAALKFGVNHLAILPFRQLGDDLVEAEYDPDLDTPPPAPTSPVQPSDHHALQNGAPKDTPYSASFVLPLTALDPALTHPLHLAFLHEYREPTFGIVSSSQAASYALLEERKDPLSYTVFTLDLDQHASTTLLSVTGLPFDIFRVIPLPLPVGGALLVGTNQLIHVDQAGKTNAVGVNEFAKQCSNFATSDQSNLAMRLEDCLIETLDSSSGDMLIIQNTGELAILSFRIDGRSVSGLSVAMVNPSQGGRVITAAPNCAAAVGRTKLFVGSEEGDSVLLGWTRKTAQLSRKRSHAQMLAEDADLSLDEEDLDDDADDDLYGDESAVSKQVTASTGETSSPENYSFRIHDSLFSIGPINSIAMGKYPASPTSAGAADGLAPPLSLLAGVGCHRSSRLAFMNRELTPEPIRTVNAPLAQSVWSVCAKQAAPRGLPKPEEGEQSIEAQMIADDQFDQYLITCSTEQNGTEVSRVFKVDNAVSTENEQDKESSSYEEVTGTEFDGDGETLNIGVLASGTRIVQVRKHDVKSYDAGESDFQYHLVVYMSRRMSGCGAASKGVSLPSTHVLSLSCACSWLPEVAIWACANVHHYPGHCSVARSQSKGTAGTAHRLYHSSTNANVTTSMHCSLCVCLRDALCAQLYARCSRLMSFDFLDLGLSQIFPILDEVTDAELAVVHSNFCDPYLLILREDSSLQILEMDSSGDLDEVERGDAALATKWLSGCIYKSEFTGNKALAFMLSADGGLAVCVQVLPDSEVQFKLLTMFRFLNFPV